MKKKFQGVKNFKNKKNIVDITILIESILFWNLELENAKEHF